MKKRAISFAPEKNRDRLSAFRRRIKDEKETANRPRRNAHEQRVIATPTKEGEAIP